MSRFVIVSYYTPSYERVAKKYLIDSLVMMDLPFKVTKIHWEEDWKENTDYKPVFIKECLQKFSGIDIVFIDADAEVRQHPTLFYNIPKEYHMACHYLDWELQYGRPTDKGKTELLSGTLYFKNDDPKVMELIDRWIENTKQYPWEQMALDMALRPDINVYKLPREYCYILTQPKGQPPAVQIEKPVIAHHQYGRIMKKLL